MSTAQDFRLESINKILERLELDNTHYTNVRNRYSKVRSIIQKVAMLSGGASALLTSAGIATILTGPGVVIGAPISVVGSVVGTVSVGLGAVIKYLSRKITKHDRTIQLIESKKGTISNLMSKALSDNVIDEREYTLIIDENESYNTLRMQIRRRGDAKSSSK